MKLDIISPEKTIYSGSAESVTLPGIKGSFTILDHHAPIISSLTQGTIIYKHKGEDVSLKIQGGFIEMNNNNITVCIE
ncbi:MAG: ATP synthase F1 subunit epsilon [Dysgonamonadaceae bacterium]|jgi:F-type H+-transporting ATPase subunit epsilon|nr:ATP synthase F1 subunit epsilon [Dysgonamonadaceae bacterium]